MKPVVTSIVALALAITPLAAFAAEKSPHKKPAHIMVVSHHQKIEKSDAKMAKAGLVKVKLTDKTPPHKEPKIEKSKSVVAPVSFSEKSAKDLPKLPVPAAGKSMKIGAEKSAPRKGSEKKSDAGKDDGQISRDEELAELVTQIRGNDEQKAKHAPIAAKDSPGCGTKVPVEMIRGAEVEKFDLAKCDGTVAPLVLEQLSVLIRPGSAARPVAPLEELAKNKGPDIAHGVRRIDPRLADRLKDIVEHFEKPGSVAKIDIVSGYRPTSIGSMHASGRAMDFRIEGVKNEELVAFCKTLNDTGCGYYPNSSFVHVDVRDGGSGHVTWIDASGPGETPRYVPTWPPPETSEPAPAPEPLTKASATELAPLPPPSATSLDTLIPPEPVDTHPSEVSQ